MYNYENGARGKTYRHRLADAEDRTPWTLRDAVELVAGLTLIGLAFYAITLLAYGLGSN